MGQLDAVGAPDKDAPRLVKADVAVAADAQQLEVRPAKGLNNPVVPGALPRGVGVGAIGDVQVLRLYIDVVEEILAHEVGVALVVIGGKAHILVQVQGGAGGKVQRPRLVPLDELFISADGAGAGSQAQDGIRLLEHLSRNEAGGGAAHLVVVLGGNDPHVNSSPFKLSAFSRR